MEYSQAWDAATYDEPRKRLVPDFDSFYETVAMIVSRQSTEQLRVLDLGAGTGILSEAIANKCPTPSIFTLFDSSIQMLTIAKARMEGHQVSLLEGSFGDALPHGNFDAVVSALSIHHLDNDAKRSLFSQILSSLSPGGVFINADQYAGPTAWHDAFYRKMHEIQSRNLGSDDLEWSAAVERMKIDRYASIEWHLDTLMELGYHNTDCFFKRFGFGVIAAWRNIG